MHTTHATATQAKHAKTSLKDHADAIHALSRRMVVDVIEIGRRLSEVKDIAGHGNFRIWLDLEFKWTERTAQRFMSVFELDANSDNLSDLNLPLSGVYLLAAPSTPEHIREQVLDRAGRGEVITHGEIRRLIPSKRAKKTLALRKAAAVDPVGDIVAQAVDLVIRMSQHQRREFAARLPSLISMRDLLPEAKPPVEAKPADPAPITSREYSPARVAELLADVDHRGIPRFLVR